LDNEKKFVFDHPYGENWRDFVKEVVMDTFGEEHCKDIDWESCKIIDD